VTFGDRPDERKLLRQTQTLIDEQTRGKIPSLWNYSTTSPHAHSVVAVATSMATAGTAAHPVRDLWAHPRTSAHDNCVQAVWDRIEANPHLSV